MGLMVGAQGGVSSSVETRTKNLHSKGRGG